MFCYLKKWYSKLKQYNHNVLWSQGPSLLDNVSPQLHGLQENLWEYISIAWEVNDDLCIITLLTISTMENFLHSILILIVCYCVYEWLKQCTYEPGIQTKGRGEFLFISIFNFQKAQNFQVYLYSQWKELQSTSKIKSRINWN